MTPLNTVSSYGLNTLPFERADMPFFETLPSNPNVPVVPLKIPAIALNAISLLPLSAA